MDGARDDDLAAAMKAPTLDSHQTNYENEPGYELSRRTNTTINTTGSRNERGLTSARVSLLTQAIAENRHLLKHQGQREDRVTAAPLTGSSMVVQHQEDGANKLHAHPLDHRKNILKLELYDDDKRDTQWCPRCGIENGLAMVQCARKPCPFRWFHLKCLAPTEMPGGEKQWFCSDCVLTCREQPSESFTASDLRLLADEAKLEVDPLFSQNTASPETRPRPESLPNAPGLAEQAFYAEQLDGTGSSSNDDHCTRDNLPLSNSATGAAGPPIEQNPYRAKSPDDKNYGTPEAPTFSPLTPCKHLYSPGPLEKDVQTHDISQSPEAPSFSPLTPNENISSSESPEPQDNPQSGDPSPTAQAPSSALLASYKRLYSSEPPRTGRHDLEPHALEPPKFPTTTTFAESARKQTVLDHSPASTKSASAWQDPPTPFQYLAASIEPGASLRKNEVEALAIWKAASMEQIEWADHLAEADRLRRKYAHHYRNADEDDYAVTSEASSEHSEDGESTATVKLNEVGIREGTISTQVDEEKELAIDEETPGKKYCYGKDLSAVLARLNGPGHR